LTYICERCLENGTVTQPQESTFSEMQEVDCHGYNTGSGADERSCTYCGEMPTDCMDCDTDYICDQHRYLTGQEAETLEPGFTRNVEWVTKESSVG
jgi:hypothetical protein